MSDRSLWPGLFGQVYSATMATLKAALTILEDFLSEIRSHGPIGQSAVLILPSSIDCDPMPLDTPLVLWLSPLAHSLISLLWSCTKTPPFPSPGLQDPSFQHQLSRALLVHQFYPLLIGIDGFMLGAMIAKNTFDLLNFADGPDIP